MAKTLEQVLVEQVYANGEYRSFGELTQADAEERAVEMKAACGWGPTTRVIPVATAWRQLADLMRQKQIPSVGDLPEETVLDYANRLWIVPPWAR